MLPSAGLGQCLVAQVQNIELVAGLSPHAHDSNGLSRHLRVFQVPPGLRRLVRIPSSWDAFVVRN
jgi:hypothetical protein